MFFRTYIRVDADQHIGTGHIMRCIALAQALKKQGGAVSFISNCTNTLLQERIVRHGFEFFQLKSRYPSSDDLAETFAFIEKGFGKGAWIVLDGYHFDIRYQKKLKQNGHRILLIDDASHLPCYHADIILNQNIHADSLEYVCDIESLKLLGTRYVLLRNEFLDQEPVSKKRSGRADRILVTLGGADPDNETEKIINGLNLQKRDDFDVRIVVGPANPHLESIEKAIKTVCFPCNILKSSNDMPSLMRWADVAISAGGSTCWELAYMGVPFMVGILAENQVGIANGLGRDGAAFNCGWYRENSVNELAEKIEIMLNDENLRSGLIRNQLKLVDGQGAERVVKAMRGVA